MFKVFIDGPLSKGSYEGRGLGLMVFGVQDKGHKGLQLRFGRILGRGAKG